MTEARREILTVLLYTVGFGGVAFMLLDIKSAIVCSILIFLALVCASGS